MILRMMLPGAAAVACTAALAAQSWTAVPAPEWDALFDRTQGWTGADGIYSIPLDGDDRPGGLARTGTLFVFSDTFIGDVLPDGRRQNATLVNNTVALLPRNGFARGPKFRWDDRGASPAAVMVPDTRASRPGDWYWFQDGIAIGDRVHVLTSRIRRNNTVAGFERVGMVLLSFPQDGPYRPEAAVQRDAPLWLPENSRRGPVFWGAGILANTAAAGAPQPDGWVYVYGAQEDPLVKKLVIARVRPADFTDFRAWRFWNGAAWVRDRRDAAAVTGRISPELSVTPTPDGRYALVFQVDTLSAWVGVKFAPTPWGPFGPMTRLYEAPLPASPALYTYNAKAHPHLSAPGELLVSYNVNALDFWDHFRYADIYRPRFVRISW